MVIVVDNKVPGYSPKALASRQGGGPYENAKAFPTAPSFRREDLFP